MKNDTISFPENVELLKKHLIEYVDDVKFKENEKYGRDFRNNFRICKA